MTVVSFTTLYQRTELYHSMRPIFEAWNMRHNRRSELLMIELMHLILNSFCDCSINNQINNVKFHDESNTIHHSILVAWRIRDNYPVR
jgi:hypothetical protein